MFAFKSLLFSSLLFSIAAFSAVPASPTALTISRAVGEVGKQIVTSREVQINRVVDQIIQLPNITAEHVRVPPSQEPNFYQEVYAVLSEWALYLEAMSFNEKADSNSKATDLNKKITELLKSHPQWRVLEVQNAELQKLLERKLIAKEFVRLKTDPTLVPVTDSDAEIYYKKNKLKFGNLPFENFRENIRAFLIRSQTEQRLKDWLEVLYRKYKVRNYISG